MEPLDRLVVTYHYVRPSNSEGVTGLSPDAFSAQICAILNRYRVVTPSEFAASPDEPGLALITFDDALRDQYDYAAPILDQLGVPAVFYAPTKPFDTSPGWCSQHLLHALGQELGWKQLELNVLDSTHSLGLARPRINEDEMNRLYHYEVPEKRRLKYLLAFAFNAHDAAQILGHVNRGVGLSSADWFMTREQLVSLRDRGHTIGSHGHEHTPLTTLSPEAQRHDLERAHSLLTTILGAAPTTIAYPFGRRDDATDRITADLGYAPAFTTSDRIDTMHLDPVLAQQPLITGANAHAP